MIQLSSFYGKSYDDTKSNWIPEAWGKIKLRRRVKKREWIPRPAKYKNAGSSVDRKNVGTSIDYLPSRKSVTMPPRAASNLPENLIKPFPTRNSGRPIITRSNKITQPPPMVR